MSLQMILKDNTAIDIAESGLSGHIVMQCADRDAFNAIWDQLTPEAVEDLTVVNNGDVVQVMENVTLDGTQTVTNPDGSLTCHFYFDGDLVSQSDEYSIAGRILMGEED